MQEDYLLRIIERFGRDLARWLRKQEHADLAELDSLAQDYLGISLAVLRRLPSPSLAQMHPDDLSKLYIIGQLLAHDSSLQPDPQQAKHGAEKALSLLEMVQYRYGDSLNAAHAASLTRLRAYLHTPNSPEDTAY